MEPLDPLDWRHLRGLLAERRITHTQFAAACGLNRAFLGRVLCGHHTGELARIKIERGMTALGLSLDREPARAC